MQKNDSHLTIAIIQVQGELEITFFGEERRSHTVILSDKKSIVFLNTKVTVGNNRGGGGGGGGGKGVGRKGREKDDEEGGPALS